MADPSDEMTCLPPHGYGGSGIGRPPCSPASSAPATRGATAAITHTVATPRDLRISGLREV
ncbi:hypothetical protein GCM10009721_07830 [Terrabacter tumescens]|uniref:Uncharacterized protein n=1 Tax=Terrabacter tumescens TaxID=60443 RepID=A0ABQ2HLN0_9MICO|nr:hypothetical protein GCM10009721_07830 [Terrabacter tumescens]